MARFDEVKATFWGEGRYGVQPPLTDAVVQDAERQLGVRLPASLLEILRVQNGGLVAELWNAFPTDVPTSWSENHVPLDEMMGIGRHDGQLSLLDSPIWLRSGGFLRLWYCCPGMVTAGPLSTTGHAESTGSRP